MHVSLGPDISLKLDSINFEETKICGCQIKTAEDLFEFWQKMGGFLMQNETEYETQELRKTMEIDIIQEKATDVISPYNSDEPLDKADSDNSEQISVSTPSNTSDDDSIVDRKQVFEKISEKCAGQFFMDVFQIKDPPSEYRVRDRNEEFIKELTDMMIAKNSVSIENAPSIIGLILMDKKDFSEDSLKTNNVYAIDGNHSMYAQRNAYKKTKDLIFQYRTINIYCNLTPEEALLLGVSRNEDAKNVLKFSDGEKVHLVRRQLYSLNDTSIEQEPPEATPQFTQIYRLLLNLKDKAAVDSKAIIRFLATKLSKRCYEKFQNICKANRSLKVSKFECLRGLEEENQFHALCNVAESNFTRADWKNFREECARKKHTKKVPVEEITTVIEFHEDHATTVLKSKAVTPFFKFIGNGKVILKTYNELQDLIFGKKNQEVSKQNAKRKRKSDKRDTYSFSSESLDVFEDADENKADIIDDIPFEEKTKHSPFIRRDIYSFSSENPSPQKSRDDFQIKDKRDIYSFSSENPSPQKSGDYLQIKVSRLFHRLIICHRQHGTRC